MVRTRTFAHPLPILKGRPSCSMLTLQPVPQPCPEMMAFCARTGDETVSVAAMASSCFMSQLEQQSTSTRIMLHKICKHIPLRGQDQKIQLTGMHKLRKYKFSNSRLPPQTHPKTTKNVDNDSRRQRHQSKSQIIFSEFKNTIPGLKQKQIKTMSKRTQTLIFP